MACHYATGDSPIEIGASYRWYPGSWIRFVLTDRNELTGQCKVSRVICDAYTGWDWMTENALRDMHYTKKGS